MESNSRNGSEGKDGSKLKLFSIDSSGAYNWSKRYYRETCQDSFEDATSIIDLKRYNKNRILLFGEGSCLGAGRPYFVMLDSLGDTVFTKLHHTEIAPFDTGYNPINGELVEASDNSFYTCGFLNNGVSLDQNVAYISKLDSNLDILWTRYGRNLRSWSSRVFELKNGNIALLAESRNEDFFSIYTYTPEGKEIGSHTYTASEELFALHNAIMRDDTVYAAFHTRNTDRAYLAKISLGDIVTEVSGRNNRPSQVYLGESFPNPVSTEATIPYVLPKGTKGRIVMHNAQVIKVREVDIFPKNSNVHLSLDELTSGVYFYTLFIDKQPVQTRRMVIEK